MSEIAEDKKAESTSSSRRPWRTRAGAAQLASSFPS
jgi:hypothetical protein